MALVELLNEIMEFIDDFVKRICMCILTLMVVTIFLQVICRYVLKNPLIWTEELSRFLMIWLAFIGSSSVMQKWENIYVDYFIQRLPKTLYQVINCIIKIIVFTFLVYIFNLCLKIFPQVGVIQKTPALGIKMIWVQFGMVVGILLMILQLASLIIKDFVIRREEND